MMRRDFLLQSEDANFVTRLGRAWETVVQGSERWVLIHEHPLVAGYDRQSVTIAVLMPGGYPETQLDMVFVHPHLSRSDGHALKAVDHAKVIDDKSFQRWSRHRTSENPWRPGEDNLETHYDLIRDWFARALEIAA